LFTARVEAVCVLRKSLHAVEDGKEVGKVRYLTERGVIKLNLRQTLLRNAPRCPQRV
jgi:hypothetical protein